MKNIGSNVLTGAKKLFSENKQLIRAILDAILATKAPSLVPVADSVWNAVGGKI